VPAFVIFHDSVLDEIVKELPVTLEEFRRIKGVGQHKLKTFGNTFISEVRDYLEAKN
jgi:ATP-dependent DNA helicase RecQ